MLWVFGVCLPLVIFQILVVGLGVNGGVLPEDVAILQMLHQTETARLDEFAEFLTFFGIVGGVIPVATAIAGVLLLRRQWQSLLYWVLALLGSSVIGAGMKLLWHRARPHLWDSFYPYPKDFSFPSGHAMASMTLVAALVLLFWKTPWRLPLLLLGGLFVLGIGWTRLYLGVHYPSDVLAGWMLAIAWVMGTWLLTQARLRTQATSTLDKTG